MERLKDWRESNEVGGNARAFWLDGIEASLCNMRGNPIFPNAFKEAWEMHIEK